MLFFVLHKEAPHQRVGHALFFCTLNEVQVEMDRAPAHELFQGDLIRMSTCCEQRCCFFLLDFMP